MSSRELECTSPPVVSGCAERRRPGIHNHWTQFGEDRLRIHGELQKGQGTVSKPGEFQLVHNMFVGENS